MAEQRDFSNVTRIWVSVLTVFGLTCVTQTSDQTYKVSYYKMIYSASVCAFLCVICYYEVAMFSSYDSDFSTVALRCLVFSSSNLASIVLVILILINANNTAELLSDVIHFNRKNRWDVYMSSRLLYSFAASGVLLFFNFWIDYFQCFHDAGTGFNADAIKMVIFGYIFPVHTFLTVGQICFQMKWMDSFLEKFINLLENFDSLKKISEEEITFQRVHSQIWQDELKTRELIKLRSIYQHLYEISRKMNKVNSSRYILTIGQNFITGTLYMYFALVGLVHYAKQNVKPITSPPWYAYLRWSVCSYLTILTIIYPCHCVASKAKKAVSAVQLLRIKSNKPKLTNELENFLIQLEEEKIEFSAHGFFQINNGLLLSLLSAASSYLIILIQSRVTFE